MTDADRVRILANFAAAISEMFQDMPEDIDVSSIRALRTEIPDRIFRMLSSLYPQSILFETILTKPMFNSGPIQ